MKIYSVQTGFAVVSVTVEAENADDAIKQAKLAFDEVKTPDGVHIEVDFSDDDVDIEEVNEDDEEF